MQFPVKKALLLFLLSIWVSLYSVKGGMIYNVQPVCWLLLLLRVHASLVSESV